MKQHSYYQLQMTLTSPMNISSGENINTDNDVLLDNRGKPYIPGTTIAGILRNLTEKEKHDFLFGTEAGENDKNQPESRVIVYDAKLKRGSKAVKEERDHVKLNEYRVAEEGKKFDEECIEPGATFIGYLEITGNAPQDTEEALENVLRKLAAQKCGFGRKTTRGFGRAALTVRKKAFDLDNPEERKAWLDFSLFDEQAFADGKEVSLGNTEPAGCHIRLKLRLAGGLSIRVYLTNPSPHYEENAPDFTTLTSNGNPAVPGSSWAGAFRHRFQELAKDLKEDEQPERDLFGYANEETNESRRSKIIFSETVLQGSRKKGLTRNAIDRASGKTKDSALYTEETCYDGTGELDIMISPDASGKAMQLFGACLCDFIHGFLTAGGLSSIGRGRFETEELSIQGKPVDIKNEGWENRLIAELKEAGR